MKRYKVICPLINFRVQKFSIGTEGLTGEEFRNRLEQRERELVRGIDLIEGVWIRQVTKVELKGLDIFPGSPSHGRLSSVRFILEKHLEDESDEFERARQTISNIVLVLRLLKPGYFSGNFIFHLSEDGTSKGCYWEGGIKLHSHEPDYTLFFDEISSLIDLTKKVQNADIEKKKRLSLACRRFHRAYEEDNVDDQLIDLIIAFEALFSKKEVEGRAFRDKVVNGCLELLGRNERQRKLIRKDLAKAYEMRNLIVHGAEYAKIELEEIVGDDEFDEEYLELDLVSRLEDYLRKSIKKFLD